MILQKYTFEISYKIKLINFIKLLVENTNKDMTITIKSIYNLQLLFIKSVKKVSQMKV